MPGTISNARADRAGDAHRVWVAGDGAARGAMAGEFLRALADIAAYRELHAYPLKKVTYGVRKMIETEVGRSAQRPGQRFKRMDRILDKLLRFPHMRLSQMEDIGGCRAVLGDLDQVYAVAARLHRRWPHSRVHDHILEPKDDGYRAIHVIERRDGRLIEVQLRTPTQDEWASTVEWTAELTGYRLKDGSGPADLRRYFAMAAQRLALEDRGDQPDLRLEADFATLRERVRRYFTTRDE